MPSETVSSSSDNSKSPDNQREPPPSGVAGSTVASPNRFLAFFKILRTNSANHTNESSKDQATHSSNRVQEDGSSYSNPAELAYAKRHVTKIRQGFRQARLKALLAEESEGSKTGDKGREDTDKKGDRDA